jgi:hypothetical protein
VTARRNRGKRLPAKKRRRTNRFEATGVKDAAHDLLAAIEAVFHFDWDFTKHALGIGDKDAGSYVAPGATFLEPHVHDESNNWGNRGSLLAAVRRLRGAIERSKCRDDAWRVE